MNNEEINRYLHVEIMGNCWHTPMIVTQDGAGRYWRCANCQAVLGHHWDEPLPPDYCSDASPRRLLKAVVAKVIELGSREKFMMALVVSCKDITVQITGANAPAEQIARACVEAHKLTAKPAA